MDSERAEPLLGIYQLAPDLVMVKEPAANTNAVVQGCHGLFSSTNTNGISAFIVNDCTATAAASTGNRQLIAKSNAV